MERWVLLHVHLRDDQRDRGRSSYVVQGMERLSTEFALWTGIEVMLRGSMPVFSHAALGYHLHGPP